MTGYYDLGSYRRALSTKSPEAQLWFDRGLIWCYGYNHEEAVRCFRRAADADPDCALAHWGIAYAAGPNYNKQWKAFDTVDLKRSLALAYGATRSAMQAIAADRRTPQCRVNMALSPERYGPDQKERLWAHFAFAPCSLH